MIPVNNVTLISQALTLPEGSHLFPSVEQVCAPLIVTPFIHVGDGIKTDVATALPMAEVAISNERSIRDDFMVVRVM
jgi:hypothetical protein